MNALITKMKMGEHERDKAVNVDELKHNGELERGTLIASATLGPIISETTLVQLC